MITGDLVPPGSVKRGDHVRVGTTWHLVTSNPDRLGNGQTVIMLASVEIPVVMSDNQGVRVLTPGQWLVQLETEVDGLRIEAETVRVTRAVRQTRTSGRSVRVARRAR